MKSPQYPQEKEDAGSIAQRLLKKKEITHEIYIESANKTAKDRRLNEFYKKEELNKEK